MRATAEAEEVLSRRGLLRAAAWLGAGAGVAALVPAAAWGAAPGQGDFPAVTRMVDSYVGSGRVAGMIAMLGSHAAAPAAIARGSLSMAEGAGAISTDSLFRIYSMTKPVTGMAAMILIDEGRLGLDQPVADILPRFAAMKVQAVPDGSITDVRPARTPITVRHLLTHTAGLGYPLVQKGPIRQAYDSAGIIAGRVGRIPLPGFATETRLRSLAEFADALAELPLVYEPGTQWSYSAGLDLLGRVIEVASGRPFEVFLKERLFDPLGMVSTGFEVRPGDESRLTTNYGILGGLMLPLDRAADSVFLDPPPFPLGGAGLVSSPRDYDRFLAMLLGRGTVDGRVVMSERAVRTGTSNLLPPGAATTGTFAAGAGYGAGGRVGLGAEAGTFGWAGAAGTVGFVDMRAGLRAGLYTQYMPSEAYPVQSEFAKAVAADLMAAGAAR